VGIADAFERVVEAGPALRYTAYDGSQAGPATAPVTLDIDNGMQLSFRPGDSMGPGSTVAGVAVPIILDRHCGND